MNAIEQLQMEIQELLAEHYQVATVEVLDDALNAVFLGKDGD